MDGQRKDATHSTIWLMPRPLLMNYVKLCPREWSHMFIMKAAGVLGVPWVAPNELHVTGRCDTKHGNMKEEKTHTGTHTHTTSTVLIGCIHQATLTELWRTLYSEVSAMIIGVFRKGAWSIVLCCSGMECNWVHLFLYLSTDLMNLYLIWPFLFSASSLWRHLLSFNSTTFADCILCQCKIAYFTYFWQWDLKKKGKRKHVSTWICFYFMTFGYFLKYRLHP